MASLSTDTQTYRDKLRASIDARMSLVEGLAAAAASRDAARVALDAAEADYAREYRGAISAGWTERELRDAGLAAPTAARATGTRRAGRSRGASATPAAVPQGGTGEVGEPLAS
ncbi:hypothetical protein [Cellulomonas sp. ES6]|uniref:hypothetical protein n=1 Tax=Cellulomonas sp. ES6 TaxID=3039384 RepID=UPI0024B82B2F|nr:hypothetical protein [Cellulomonas sp. ES6]WHP16479.1 hypothetical protein P9841_12725 [Cellulomonas sp. ES6]